MEEIVRDLEAQHAELAALLATVDWERPSRCEGWTVADVVTHLSQSDELALASLEGRMGEAIGDVDEWAAVGVEAERGQSTDVALARWTAATTGLCAALRADDPSRRVQWVTGTLSVQTLTATRLAEAWIHTNDVAAVDPTDRLRHIARLAWRTLPYAFAKAGRELTGPVAFHLTAPSGAEWRSDPTEPAATVVRGPGADLCDVAGQRRSAATTALVADGPDAEPVLELVRTFA